MAPSQEPKFNGDLLLNDADRERALEAFPTLFYVLDFPKLRDVFCRYEMVARKSKRRLRLAGMATIVFGVIALIGAATAPLYEQAPSHILSKVIIVVSAAAGLLSILIGTFGVFNLANKRSWLQARLMTERLRQFHFETLAYHIPSILNSTATVDLKKDFCKTRDRWLSVFQLEYEDRLPGKLKEVLDDEAEENFILTDPETLQGTEGKELILKELFSAYRLLRIKYQIQHANYVLGSDSLGFPRKQIVLLSAISLICILIVFFTHFAISISFLGDWLPPSFVTEWLSFVRRPEVHVLVVWTAIVVLAVRTLEEGLQPTREVERYTAYKARLGRLLDHFEKASEAVEKVRIMTDVEHAVYQEMRGFLKTNDEARFVL